MSRPWAGLPETAAALEELQGYPASSRQDLQACKMGTMHSPKPTSKDTAPLPAPPALAGSSPAGTLSAELSATDTTEAEEAPRSGFNSRKTAATAAAVRGEASAMPCNGISHGKQWKGLSGGIQRHRIESG